jgi:hypothetical protein
MNSLHPEDDMLLAGSDDEVGRLPADLFVLMGCQHEPLGAGLIRTLADPVHQRHPESVLLVDVVDALVNFFGSGEIRSTGTRCPHGPLTVRVSNSSEILVFRDAGRSNA